MQTSASMSFPRFGQQSVIYMVKETAVDRGAETEN